MPEEEGDDKERAGGVATSTTKLVPVTTSMEPNSGTTPPRDKSENFDEGKEEDIYRTPRKKLSDMLVLSGRKRIRQNDDEKDEYRRPKRVKQAVKVPAIREAAVKVSNKGGVQVLEGGFEIGLTNPP